MSLQWQTCSDPPEAMSRGSAVSHDKMAYFNPDASTAVYQFEEDQWTAVQWGSECPHYYSALTVVNEQLTTVGGRHVPWGGEDPTNSLASLTGEGKDRKWVEHFPRMPTSRSSLAAVCRGTSLIAAGGRGGRRRLRTVEVMDTESLQWTLVNPLPHPMYGASIAVSQEKVYLLGGYDQNGRTLSVFTCSTLQTQPLDAQLEKPANQMTPWHQVADAPHYSSTAVCVGEVLLAIGGGSAAGEKTSAIAAYNPTSDSWEDIGHMTTPRSRPLVALLPSNELIVAGGYGGYTKVEIGKIVA